MRFLCHTAPLPESSNCIVTHYSKVLPSFAVVPVATYTLNERKINCIRRTNFRLDTYELNSSPDKNARHPGPDRSKTTQLEEQHVGDAGR